MQSKYITYIARIRTYTHA